MKQKAFTFLAGLLTAGLLMPISVFSQVKSWTPDVEMEKQIFPSYIIAKSTLAVDNDTIINGVSFHYEDSIDLFSVDVDIEKEARIKIEILASVVNDHSTYEEVLPAGEHLIYPKINYRFNSLRQQVQPTPVNVQFVLSVNGVRVGQQSITAQVRAISDCPFFYQSDAGLANLGYMFAAYVNEDHPAVDEILKESLQSGIVNSFQGYQGTKSDVTDQLLAVWYTLQHRGIKYSSITDNSGEGNGKLYSQRIRSFSDVMSSNQANCVDGSAFMASIYKSIGLKPFLVRIPGHCFLGVYTKEDRSELMVLETTAIGWGDFSGKPIKSASSISTSTDFFNQAQDYAIKNYNKYFKDFNTIEHPECQLIDIDTYRSVGIKPIGR